MADIPLNLPAIAAQIAHWETKHTAARNDVERAVADGNLNALLTVRVIHGLPVEEVA
jgi:hypothetical protein